MSDKRAWPTGVVVILPHQLSLLVRSEDLCVFPVEHIELDTTLRPHRQTALKTMRISGLIPEGPDDLRAREVGGVGHGLGDPVERAIERTKTLRANRQLTKEAMNRKPRIEEEPRDSRGISRRRDADGRHHGSHGVRQRPLNKPDIATWGSKRIFLQWVDVPNFLN